MGVTKYRSAGDMPPPPRVSGAALAATIRAVWARSRRLAPPAYTPGVQKFADIGAAQRARELEQRGRIRRLRTIRAR
ncbi:MAG: hypothetical protein HYY06_33580 [Deltaproteobacteria bacterium]|nr:hypothetical protein [Deltaproteobacteria bacterium]